MCRLFAITSDKPVSPFVALNALDVMREGHDGSGVGLFLRDLGGPFDEMKEAPILSGIFTKDGIKHLDTAIIGPDRQEINICHQTDPLPPLH